MKRIILVSAMLVAAGCSSSNREAQPRVQQSDPESKAVFTGTRGPEGPTGAKGAQGQTGATGEAGYALAGPRGEAGPAGARGEQGRTGVRGEAGDVTAGPTGVVGGTGSSGEAGQIGATGARGASAEGTVGAIGAAGQAGKAGTTGQAGVKGPTLVGPAGPAGRSGPTGAQGDIGRTGAQGSTTAGLPGEAGVAGVVGPQGERGEAGPQGPAGVIEQWITYREFWFDTDQANVHKGDADTVTEIAAYLKQNPSLQVGIDSTIDTAGTDQAKATLATQRGHAVRDALVAAGVTNDRISFGDYGQHSLRRDQRVALMLRTDPDFDAQRIRPDTAADARESWTANRAFSFESDKTALQSSDALMVREIAAQVKADPALQVGLDGSTNPRATQQSERDLCARRVKAVHDALIAAGVPADRITEGEFGTPELRQRGRVQVMTRTNQMTDAQ